MEQKRKTFEIEMKMLRPWPGKVQGSIEGVHAWMQRPIYIENSNDLP